MCVNNAVRQLCLVSDPVKFPVSFLVAQYCANAMVHWREGRLNPPDHMLKTLWWLD